MRSLYLLLFFGTVISLCSAKCICNCEFDYRPLCAESPQGELETFPNRCMFQCHTCTMGVSYKIKREGECPTATTTRRPPPCNCNCPTAYQPVCARDATTGTKETFNNRCMLDCYNCTHSKNYAVRNQGECPTQPPPTRPFRRPGRARRSLGQR